MKRMYSQASLAKLRKDGFVLTNLRAQPDQRERLFGDIVMTLQPETTTRLPYHRCGMPTWPAPKR